MRKTILNKTSSALVALLIASMLLPVLSFAAEFDGFRVSNDGTVTGYVYLSEEEYNNVVDNVYIHVSDKNGNWYQNAISVTADTYTIIDGKYVFEFSYQVTDNVYNPIRFGFGEDSVSNWVYQPERPSPGPGAPGGIGGGIAGPSITDGQIDLGWSNEISAADLLKAFEQSKHVTVKTNGDFVKLPAAALKEAKDNGGLTVTVVNAKGTYELPLSAIDYDDLADELNAELRDVKLNIQIKEAAQNVADNINKAIEALNGEQVAKAIDFSIIAEAFANSVEVKHFGNIYVNRTIPVEGTLNPNTATAVAYDVHSNQLQFVPSTFSTESGETVATIKRNSNSVYTVIQLDQSFDDIQGHWGQSYIELLANKLVVNGVGNGLFAPERDINRAEFAALLVRSLGLELVKHDGAFTDVDANAWYAGIVTTAANAGLVLGYPDGSFRPTATITRQEIAAMVVRAMAYAGEEVQVSASDADRLLAKYSDASQVTWAKTEMAAAIQAGIVQGMSETTLRPAANATRAQSATMLERYLKYVGFINS